SAQVVVEGERAGRLVADDRPAGATQAGEFAGARAGYHGQLRAGVGAVVAADAAQHEAAGALPELPGEPLVPDEVGRAVAAVAHQHLGRAGRLQVAGELLDDAGPGDLSGPVELLLRALVPGLDRERALGVGHLGTSVSHLMCVTHTPYVPRVARATGAR